jgi:hypothetical protein
MGYYYNNGEYSEAYGGLAIGIIVAIAISVFFFVCVIPAIGCCIWRKRKHRLAARNKEAAEAFARMQAQRAAQGTGYPPTAGYGQPTNPPVNGYYAQPPKEAYQYGPQTAGVQQV